jgi:release factor glutamine methyltransferase
MASIAEGVAQAAERLSHGPHAERARLDAEMLLGAVLKKNKAWLHAHGEETLPETAVPRLAEWVERRSFGEPLQYILGETEFYRLPFRVTRDVLIPRPETEQVIEHVLHLIPVFDRRPKRLFEVRRIRPATHDEEKGRRTIDPHSAGWPPRILDVGTGSGCIAVSIAHDCSEAEITATDLSASALELACFNAERLGYAKHIRFLQGDLLEPVAGEQFDLIISNPPYVAERDRDSLAVEVRDFEPAQALFAGEDGLAVYRRLIPAAHAALVPGGWIVLEIGFGQEMGVCELLNAAGFEAIEFAADLQGIARVASARRP